MRLNNSNLQDIDRERVSVFAQWLLNVGNGNIGTPNDCDPENCSWVDIPEHYCIPDDGDGISNLIDFIYNNETLHYPLPTLSTTKSCLCYLGERIHILAMMMPYPMVMTEERSMATASISKSIAEEKGKMIVTKPDVTIIAVLKPMDTNKTIKAVVYCVNCALSRLCARFCQVAEHQSEEEEEPKGNMNGWLIEDEDEPLGYEASDKEVESDLESIARKMAPSRRSGPSNEENPDIATIIAQQFQNILPQIVTQVTNNVNNANGRNGGNGGNNGCTYKGFMACNPKEYDGKGGAIALTRWIEKMENVIDNSGCAENQKMKYAASSFVNKALTWWNTQVQARGREAAIGMSWTDFKVLLVEEFCPSNEMEKLETKFWNHKMVGANHAGYTDRFHELAKLVPHLVTLESSRIKRYIAGLAPEIRGMLRATQPTTIQSAILRAGILTDEVVSCGTLTKGNEIRKGVEETSKQGGWRNDDKRAKVSKGFVAATPYRNGYAGPHLKCAKCWTHHPEGGHCLVCFNCQKPGHFARNCRMPIKQVAPINAVRGEHEPGTLGALQNPNVETGTFSLNNHYCTVLFESGDDFSFVSTDFAPLLNVKPSFVNPGYVIEVVDGKKVEVDRIIRNCKLELGNSLFTIDLIPLGHGSFDVIVGMDWLSKHKAEIVCHEKVVRIPLESGEILHVQGERTLGIAKALSNVKVDESQLSDISVVRDFVKVFPKDLSGLPPQRQVEFRIDLVPGATPVAKSPYRLAPSEMQELSGQHQELQDKGFIRPSHSPWVAPVLFVKKKDGALRMSALLLKDRSSVKLSSARRGTGGSFEAGVGIADEGEVVCKIFQVLILVTRSAIPWSSGQPEWYSRGSK
ncbi:putative reverse transcriptase domain-containing protein [Tanacetum coccineum]